MSRKGLIERWKKKKRFIRIWHDSCSYKNHKMKKTFKTVCIDLFLAIVEVSVASRKANPADRSFSERKGGTLAIAL